MAPTQTTEMLEKARQAGNAQLHPGKTRIAVGMATCGKSSGAGKVFEAFAKAIEAAGLDIALTQTGCIGFCEREPLADIAVAGGPRVIYERLTEKKAADRKSVV